MDINVTIQSLTLLFLAYLTAAKLDLDNPDDAQCSRSAVDYNATLTNGGKAGKFWKLENVNKIEDCINHCCDSNSCDVAFLVTKSCYLVECYDKVSCEVQQANKPKMGTVLSVVNKKSKSKLKDKHGAEPAVDENLAEQSPFIDDDGLTSVSAFGTGKHKRTKRSSDIIDLVVAIGCGTVAVCVGVAGVIMMTRRLIDNSKNSAA